MKMVDKKSPYYVRSEYEWGFYGNENYTTFERKLKVVGKDRDTVKDVARGVKAEVMP
jgi:hypothetical protein